MKEIGKEETTIELEDHCRNLEGLEAGIRWAQTVCVCMFNNN